MLVRKHLKTIKNYKPGKPIEEVKRQLRLKKVIKLASNENPFPPSKKIREILTKNITNINRYPDSQGYHLKKFLAKKLKVSSNNIILGNGSDELIVLALRAFVEPDEEVIVGYPTFLIYEIQAKAFNLKVVRSRLKNFRYDLNDIRSKINKKTKLIFIANPDNPNGTYLNNEEVDNFLKHIPKNIIVFFDEAYFEFAPKDFPKIINFLKRGYNIVFSRTFSKAYSLAGLRIGYAVSKKELIKALDKVREPFNINSLAQLAAEASLKDRYYLKTVINYINKEKNYLYREFNKLGLNYIRSATNFILINLGRLSSKLVFEKLLRKGIIVREMSPWGYKNFIRVTAGKHSENIKFIKALKGIIESN